MVKKPQSGRVKTRLGAGIGMPEAAWWYRHQTRHLLQRLTDPRWRLALAVSPDRPGPVPFWPTAFARIPQGRGDIGARMLRALCSVSGPVVLIGSDIPGVRAAHIHGAFKALGAAETVIGPASDGGFWLIGLRHPKRVNQSLFKGVSWSRPETLAQALPSLPTTLAFIEELQDVDTIDDLA